MDGPILIAILCAAASLGPLCVFIALRSGRAAWLRSWVTTVPPERTDWFRERVVLFGLPATAAMLAGVGGICGVIGAEDLGHEAPYILKLIPVLLLLAGVGGLRGFRRVRSVDEGWYPS